MLILITNTCHMDCPHCMECSSPEPQHMTWAHIEKSCEFAIRHGSSTVLLSGGELTCHPDWNRAARLFAPHFLNVLLSTNGAWLGSPVEDEMLALLRECPTVNLQISSFPGLYREYDRISSAVKPFAQRLKAAGLKRRMAFESIRSILDEKMLALGRACEHEDLRALAAKSNVTASCIVSSIVSAQVPLDDVIHALEMRGKFCRPVIDCKGLLHWSESMLCPSFASLDEPDGEIVRKAHEWRPCGKCEGFKKFLARTDPQYVSGRAVLGF